MIPQAGETWAPRFTSHDPFEVRGFDPAIEEVYRMCPDGAILTYPLDQLLGGWHDPKATP